MGTAIRSSSVDKLMKRYLLIFALVSLVLSRSLGAEPMATERVIRFLTNVYTGYSMKADEWLSKETRNAPKFKAFGGLSSLVKQSTARAREFDGLKSVTVIEVMQEGPAYAVKASVAFIKDHRKIASGGVAEREEIVWDFRVSKEDGAWRLSF